MRSIIVCAVVTLMGMFMLGCDSKHSMDHEMHEFKKDPIGSAEQT